MKAKRKARINKLAQEKAVQQKKAKTEFATPPKELPQTDLEQPQAAVVSPPKFQNKRRKRKP